MLFNKLVATENSEKRVEIINNIDDSTCKVLYQMAKGWQETVHAYAFERHRITRPLNGDLPEPNIREIAVRLKGELYQRTTGKPIEAFFWEGKDLSVIYIAYAYMIQAGDLDLTFKYGSKEKGYRALARKHGFMDPKKANQFKNRIIHYGSPSNRKGIKEPYNVLHDLMTMISPRAFDIAKNELFPNWPDFTF